MAWQKNKKAAIVSRHQTSMTSNFAKKKRMANYITAYEVIL